jgi:hypothetical protein
VAQRHWNAHAFINIAVWLAVDAGNASADTAATSAANIKAARVVFGYPAVQKGEMFLSVVSFVHVVELHCVRREVALI